MKNQESKVICFEDGFNFPEHYIRFVESVNVNVEMAEGKFDELYDCIEELREHIDKLEKQNVKRKK